MHRGSIPALTDFHLPQLHCSSIASKPNKAPLTFFNLTETLYVECSKRCTQCSLTPTSALSPGNTFPAPHAHLPITSPSPSSSLTVNFRSSTLLSHYPCTTHTHTRTFAHISNRAYHQKNLDHVPQPHPPALQMPAHSHHRSNPVRHIPHPR